MKYAAALLVLGLGACASTGEEPTIVRKPHLSKAGILPGQSIPQERDGLSKDDTGAIQWVCANTDKHEDKEVFISVCPSCSQMNYFYRDQAEEAYRCYACLKLYDNALIKCSECGRPPHRIRTKPQPK
jgi:hypothetical protein